MPDKHLAELSVLDGRHRLTVHALASEETSFTLRYSAVPPFPEGEDETPVLPAIEAEDDTGTDYSDRGGAYGLSADGTRTEGSITAAPGIPANAHQLTVHLTFLRAGEESVHEVRLEVPGPQD